MSKSVEGIYRDGKVELLGDAPDESDVRVIVTFPDANSINLAERGVDETQARELRGRLESFASDWDRPEMDVYDAE